MDLLTPELMPELSFSFNWIEFDLIKMGEIVGAIKFDDSKLGLLD